MQVGALSTIMLMNIYIKILKGIKLLWNYFLLTWDIKFSTFSNVMSDSQYIRQPKMSTGYGPGLHIRREHEIRTGVLAWLPVGLIVLIQHSRIRLYILYWSCTVHIRASCMEWQTRYTTQPVIACISLVCTIVHHAYEWSIHILAVVDTTFTDLHTYLLRSTDKNGHALMLYLLQAEMELVRYKMWFRLGALDASTRISRKIAIFPKTVSSTTYIKWSLVSFITFYPNSKHDKRTNIHVKR